MQINDIKIYVVTLMCSAVALWSCSKDSDVWEIPWTFTAEAQFANIGYNQTTNTLTTSGNPDTRWAAVINSDADEWCSFENWQDNNASLTSAAGQTGKSVTVYTKINDSADDRTANITVKFSNGTTVTVTFTQYGYSDNATYARDWGEQPDNTLSGNNIIYKTYYTTLSGRNYSERNYSICYDTEKMVSRWVAYPVHSSYMSPRSYKVGGSTQGRTNAWAFDDAETEYLETNQGYNYAYSFISKYDKSLDTYDTYTNPIIPQKYQQNIGQKQADGSIYNNGGSPAGYNRGHMLPSASRYNTWNTNAQTFYATNMMPQNGSFNSGSWSDVETAVRNMACNDTLYVVVGTLFENSHTLTTNNRTITVPSHCFKLMLRTKSGKTGKKIKDITNADDLICIGFLYENAASAANKTFSQAVVSVAEVEERSGFKFFRNINPQIADQVKSQKNLNDWGAFK